MGINTNLALNVLNNSLLHFLVLFIILSYLFFQNIAKSTGDLFTTTITNIIDKTFTEANLQNFMPLNHRIRPFLDPQTIAKDEYIAALKEMGITKENYNNYIDTVRKYKNEVKELNNKNLYDKAFLIIFFLSAIVLILNVLPRLFGVSLKINVLELIMFFIFLCLVEYILYSHITNKFVPILPSEVLEYLKIKLLSKFE